MAYDRYDTRDAQRGDRSRWSSDRNEREWNRDRNDRGFFERAGDEVASWFGDDDAERRRRDDHHHQDHEHGERGEHRGGRSRSREQSNRPASGYGGGWGSSAGDLERGSNYRPLTGDYGRSPEYFTGSSFERGGPREAYYGLPAEPAGYARESSRDSDPHYRSMRQRHIDELDRDYDDYRREHQSRFENDFGSWREKRMHKRGLLTQIREHMEVVGNDDGHIGTVDRIISDRIVLAKSDPESGGAHHSLSCTDIDRVEGEKVILDCSADQAKARWRDESRSRALFEREDQGEMGPHALNRSFSGTYR
jgi:hypothetical protein